MNEKQNVTTNLLDTTDSLEAVGVFKGWKNFFFVVIIICLLLIQACFWLVNIGWIEIPPVATAADGTEIKLMPLIVEFEQDMSQDADEAVEETATEQNMPFESDEPNQSTETVTTAEQPAETSETEVTAEPAEAEIPTAEPNTVRTAMSLEPPKPAEEKKAKGFPFGITYEHLVWTMQFVNALLILTVALYCLTMLFSLKISMLGRLGGINHITRAFFLSLLALIFLLPWQKVFSSIVVGAVFTPAEMETWFRAKTPELFDTILYYLRFCGFWLLILLLIILAQIRSSRWAGAILRRLEII
ncbi:MAG: hypothetical protein JW715_06575 [Sedimentisphaerales bacterium]|nr:hypothetical protein [Sedimentisphaerales bacterium]